MKKSTMKLNRFLSNKYVIALVIIILDLLLLIAITYLVNSIQNLGNWIRDIENPKLYFGFSNLKFIQLKTEQATKWFYVILFLLMAILDARFIYNIRTSYSDKNFNIGQKGKSRPATLKEIRAQYKKIAERDIEYDGPPGIIISRDENNIYIDDSPVNNLILGITRVGKGELLVTISIEIYSRAKDKASMVIIDPKPELYKMCKKELEKRGYDCYVLNLAEVLQSMGYNPLQLILELYEIKDYSRAELMANTFSYSIFNPDQQSGTEKYFSETAAQVLTGMILAMTEDCLYEDEKLNTERFEIFTKKQKAFAELLESEKAKARENFLKKEKEEYIYNREVKYIPTDVQFVRDNKYKEQVNMYSMMNIFTELSRKYDEDEEKTLLDIYFQQRPHLDRAKFRYSSSEIAGNRTKGNIFSTMLSKLSIFTLENVAKMTAKSSLDMLEVGYGEKPIAIFITTPDYDKSLHFLATVYIRQLYYVLAKEASKTVHCKRRVKFICDEMGVLPAIESMDNIITVCLSRWMSFDIYVQSYEQLREKYGKAAKTIIDNCGNRFWILASDEDSAKEFSNLLGSETITDIQRGGKKLGFDKYFTESNIDKPLMDPNQLMRLKPRECVVHRLIKRTDLKGNPVTPNPIFNLYETGTQLKYRYEYLQDIFPNAEDVDESELNLPSVEGINIEEIVFDYKLPFKRYSKKDYFTENAFEKDNNLVMELTYWDTIDGNLKESLGEHYKEMYSITADMTVLEFEDFIEKSYIDDLLRRAITSLIQIKQKE